MIEQILAELADEVERVDPRQFDEFLIAIESAIAAGRSIDDPRGQLLADALQAIVTTTAAMCLEAARDGIAP